MKDQMSRRGLLSSAAGVGVVTAAAVVGLAGKAERVGRNVDLRVRPVPVHGFAGGSALVYAGASEQATMFDVAAAGRATGIRFDVPWIHVQPAADQFDWTFIDRVVDVANQRGLFCLATIATSPGWAAAGPDEYPYNRPRSAAEYAEFCGAVAARYAGRVDAYEIWNEPNGRMFFSPNPDPAFYASMVRAAYTRIKAAAPEVTVVAGAMGPAPDGDGLVNANAFLTAMYANGVSGSCDAISFHPYDFGGSFAVGTLYDNSPMRQMIRMHATMKANGDGGKKLWLTEYGVPTFGPLTQDVQMQLICDSMLQWREVSYSGPMFIHTLKDASTGSSHFEDNFGVATSGFVAKKALYGIEHIARSGFPQRAEAGGFQQGLDPALGRSVSPIYRISHGFGYEFEGGTRFYTNHGFISSPPEVAAIARRAQLVPRNAFENDMQDMDVLGGFRVFSRPDTTGTHAVAGAILAAWTPDLGFPTSDEYTPAGTQNKVSDFEYGRITWSPTGGITIQRS